MRHGRSAAVSHARQRGDADRPARPQSAAAISPAGSTSRPRHRARHRREQAVTAGSANAVAPPRGGGPLGSEGSRDVAGRRTR